MKNTAFKIIIFSLIISLTSCNLHQLPDSSGLPTSTTFTEEAISPPTPPGYILSYEGNNGSGWYTFQGVKQTISDPRQSGFFPYYQNPIIDPTVKNLYAPSVLKIGRTWYAYFGGWKTLADVHDQVYLSTTTDDSLVSGWSASTKAVDNGFYEHVNDASVVKLSDVWVIALTTWDGSKDSCSVITSPDAITWNALVDRRFEVTFNGATVNTCARPSLIWNPRENRWEMYFDGEVNGGIHEQHLAYSTETPPRHFIYQQGVGDMNDADIKLVGGLYIASFRLVDEPSPWKIRYATSEDGRNFANHGILLEQDPDPSVAYDDEGGVTNPGWVLDGSIIKALMYSGSTPGVEDHKLGIAFPQLAVTVMTGAMEYANRQSLSADEQRVGTGADAIGRVQVQETIGDPSVIDQPISASTGAVFLIWPNIASIPTAGLLPTPAPTSVIHSYKDAPRVSAFASSSTDPFATAMGIDDDTDTFWSSTGRESSSGTEWYVVDMGTSQNLGRIRVVPRPFGYGFPQDFKFQISNDGTTWQDIPGQSYLAYAGTFTFTFNPVSARYVRMYATRLGADDHGDWYFQILEIYPQIFSR